MNDDIEVTFLFLLLASPFVVASAAFESPWPLCSFMAIFLSGWVICKLGEKKS